MFSDFCSHVGGSDPFLPDPPVSWGSCQMLHWEVSLDEKFPWMRSFSKNRAPAAGGAVQPGQNISISALIIRTLNQDSKQPQIPGALFFFSIIYGFLFLLRV